MKKYNILFFHGALCVLLMGFNFDGPMYPFLFFDEIEGWSQSTDRSLNYCQAALRSDWLWHLDFFENQISGDQQLAQRNTQVTVLVLDTDLANTKDFPPDIPFKFSKIECFLKTRTKMSKVKTFSCNDQTVWNKRKLLSELMKKKSFVQKLLQKNHSFISAQLIAQICPQAKIIIIPVLHGDGTCRKEELLDGLLQAAQHHPNIVHVGLQCYDVDEKQSVDQKITRLLQQFPLVVCAAGNDGKEKKVGWPACSKNCISVGAFARSGPHFPICHFSQSTTNSKVDFMMPGRNIMVFVWVEEIDDYIIIATHGTSMAAALMTGLLAWVWQNSTENISVREIMHLICTSCTKLDHSWHEHVNYGIPLITEPITEWLMSKVYTTNGHNKKNKCTV